VKKQEGDSVSVPLKITELKIDIQVIGNISRTTLDLTFYNVLSRQLEGEFCFPLGEGQSVSAFALEVEGKMREGSVVTKQEGRQAFESVVRRRIDPGLLEWTAGNNFRARVFPIPAKGSKRIRIAFEQELLSSRNAYVYFLPMGYSQAIDRVFVHAEVISQTSKPEPAGSGITTLEFNSVNTGWVGQLTFERYTPSAPIAFEIPRSERTQHVFTEQLGGDSSCFYLSVEPVQYLQEKKLPSRICLLWDVSASGKMRDLKKEKEILAAYFSRIKHASIRLVTFSNEVDSDQEFTLDHGTCEALNKALDKLYYDGGTQLGALDLKNYPCDEFLLFSDGLSNFGEQDMQLSKAPLLAIASSQNADYALLNYLAKATNGRFINSLTCTVMEAVRMLETQPYRFIGASCKNSTISNTYPSLPSDFRRSFALSGILKGTEGEMILNFGVGSDILYSEKVKINQSAGKAGAESTQGILRRVWAEKRIAELDGRFEENKELITQLGKSYSIVTRNTSLLVLDRLEDYVQYHILPADATMRKDYLAILDNRVKEKIAGNKIHIEQVVADFNKRQEWWKTDFKPEAIRKGSSKRNGNGSGGSSDSTVVMYDMVSPAPLRESYESEGGSEYKTGMATGSYLLRARDGNSNAKRLKVFSDKNMDSPFDGQTGEIELKNWDPNEPYLTVLKQCSKGELLETYRKERDRYKDSPAFFLDVSDYFARQGETRMALRILSNLAELKAEDHQALRVLAHRLQQQGSIKLAISCFRKVLKLRGEEPQSYRDLGLALAENKQYPEALKMLCRVVNRSWDSRFPEVESLVAAEINHILKQSNLSRPDSLDPRLVADMPVDVRVVINWDSNDCDMDLWTTDPYGELCMYNHPLTKAGGRISRDFTGGYGPEEFLIRKASPGKYSVQVNYYGTHEQTLFGPTTVQAELYTNYGKAGEKKKVITLRLKSNKEVIDIGDLVFGGN
jgi:tetratricopeptide (TPR) repeat protein